MKSIIVKLLIKVIKWLKSFIRLTRMFGFESAIEIKLINK